MIGDLTPAQRARFPEFVEKWTRIGLCTEPANRAEAERGVALFYRQLKMPPPTKVVWCSSPMAMCLTHAFALKYMEDANVNLEKPMRTAAWEKIFLDIRNALRSKAVTREAMNLVRQEVQEPVMKRTTDTAWFPVVTGIRDAIEQATTIGGDPIFRVGDRVWESVWPSVLQSIATAQPTREPLSRGVAESVWGSVDECGYGQHHAGSLVVIDFFRSVCGLEEETEPWAGMEILARNAGWWLPQRTICWISERQNVLHLNDRGQLHCENGMALAYPDGWGVYALNGIRMPEELVMTPAEQLDPALVLREPNMYVRRELLRKIGSERFLQTVPHHIIELRDNHALLSVRLAWQGEDTRFLMSRDHPDQGWRIECLPARCATIREAMGAAGFPAPTCVMDNINREYNSGLRKVLAFLDGLKNERTPQLGEPIGHPMDNIVRLATYDGADPLIAKALLLSYPPDTAWQIASHLSDWFMDGAFIMAMHLFPERFTPEEIMDGVVQFLIHAPNHIAAATKLAGWPIKDVFEVGVFDDPEDETAG